jgi:hypothetical protein
MSEGLQPFNHVLDIGLLDAECLSDEGIGGSVRTYRFGGWLPTRPTRRGPDSVAQILRIRDHDSILPRHFIATGRMHDPSV